jgi:tetratricopeptide (TPR) repeat protein
VVWWVIAQMGYESPEIADPKIFANRNKALELDPDLADIHGIDAIMAHQGEWNWEKSEKLFLKALAINPNDAQSRVLYGQLLCNLQRPGEALTQGQLAIELDPNNPLVQVWYSSLLNDLGDCEAALTYLEKLVATNQGHLVANIIIEMAAFQCKDYEKAFQATKHILPLEEDALKEIEAIFEKQGFVAAYEEITNQMEVVAQNGRISQVAMARRYTYADRPDKAMDWLEKGFEEHDPIMPFIATKANNFEPLYDNPRFIDILVKMNLPLPNSEPISTH